MKKLVGILGGLLFVAWLGWPNMWIIAGGTIIVLLLAAVSGREKDTPFSPGPPPESGP